MIETNAGPKNQLKEKLLKRLEGYWKLEALNVFLVPGFGIGIVFFWLGSPIRFSLVLALIATSWLLVLGTIALRIMLWDFKKDPACSEYWLPFLHRAQPSAFVLILIADIVAITDFVLSYAAITASHYAAIAFALLATLEYINYYHRQLQHFDNAADFQRLITGRGFRKSHLARALSAWRAQSKN